MPPKKPVAGKATAKPAAKPAGAKPIAKTAAKKPVGKAAPGPAKKGAAPAKGAAAKKDEKPAQKKWTPQDDAARKIQTKIRQFLAKAKLQKLKKDKQDYEDLMNKLEQEAFVYLVKMEQEEAERQREKEEAARRKKKEEAKRRKRMLEAAFDGDMDEINTIIKEVEAMFPETGDSINRALRLKHVYNVVECEDANKNSAVSEAAAGGVVESVKFFLDRGAQPNSRGHYGRTPLYRAAFAGHLEATQTLLAYGADPRLYADDGQMPAQIASLPAIKELLEEWDVEQTDKLLEKLEKEKDRRKEEDQKRREAEASKIEDLIEEADNQYKIQQKQLMKATEELNKRINEHDTGAAMGFERPEVTIQMIHDSEADLEIAKMHFDKARDELSTLKLKLRDKQLEGKEGGGAEQELPGLKVMVRELDEVLLRDVGNRIEDSGKWPLIIDVSGQAATFIRYRDTNYINALSPQQMEVEKIRLAVLGSVRFGKPLVMDMMEVDMMDAVSTRFDAVLPGLLQHIMDKSIMKEEVYIKLIKESDGPSYQKNQFMEHFSSRFKFWIISKNPFQPEDLLAKTYPIRIHIPT